MSNNQMREALQWYQEQARLARLIHSEGDKGRHALAEDGGKRAEQALAAEPAEHVYKTPESMHEASDMYKPADEQRPPNCGTGFCSCIECPYGNDKPAEEAQPVAWESTTDVYKKFVSDSQYRKFSPAARKFYKPFKCSSCNSQPTTEAVRKLVRLTNEEIKQAMMNSSIYGYSLMQLLRDDVDVELFRKALTGIANAIMDAMEEKAALAAVRGWK